MKTGLDDYLVDGHTVDDLWELVKPTPPALVKEKDDEAAWFDNDVAEQVRRLRVSAEAKRRFTIEQQGEAPPFDDGLLSDILCRPPEPPYRIDRTMPSNGATLVVAQRKTGKTSLNLNCAHSLITGEKFLGEFQVQKISGRVGILNYEMSAQQLGQWAAQVGIEGDRLYQVNLRGRRNPLSHPGDRAKLAARLRSHEVESLIVDPFGRAYTGSSQQDNGEVGAWVIDLDLFARAEAGVADLILTVHAGWNQERTRGASALEDWADTILTLTRGNTEEDKDFRYLRAIGRDVDIEEDKLDFDPQHRKLTLSGAGGRRKSKTDNVTPLLIPIKRVVEKKPGVNGTDLLAELRRLVKEGKLSVKFQNNDVSKAAKLADKRGLIRREELGSGKPTLHWPVSEPCPDPSGKALVNPVRDLQK
jgi:AAA domain